MSGLHYKKDGSLDMRYSSSKQATSSGGGCGSSSSRSAASGYGGGSYSSHSGGYYSPFYSPSYSPSYGSHQSSSSSSGLHHKKDGSLDMRYSSSKEAAASGYGGRFYSCYTSGGDSGLHYKKDGSLDMRYSSSKQAAGLADNLSQMHVKTPSSEPHYKKDGSLDMRYSSSKQAAAAGYGGGSHSSSASVGAAKQKSYGIPDYVPKKKDGTPNMRTRAAKDWVAGEAAARTTGGVPLWVPKKKDGSVDLTTAIGRAFANRGSHKVQQREDYWRSRIVDDIFHDLVMAQRQRSVPPVEPAPVLATPLLYNECRHQTSIPDTVPHIDYSSLEITVSESSELGRGSFGVVLKGKWNGKDVAVKKLHLDELTKKEKDSFRKEIVILANLGMHPNLVKLYGYCLSPPCIVMELVQRGSISYLLHYCEDPEVEAKMADGRVKKNLILGIVNGMRQLHASRIVHADLKPQNVLVTTDYTAKVTDFGLSRLRGKTSSSVASRQFGDDDDEKVNVAGTAGYMAPELLDSTSPPDFSVDVFSFGVIVNEMICEEEPYSDQYANFAGRGPFGAANYAKQGKRPTVSHKTPAVVKSVIERCWASDPAARPSFEGLLGLITPVAFRIPDVID